MLCCVEDSMLLLSLVEIGVEEASDGEVVDDTVDEALALDSEKLFSVGQAE